jgi:hypothetical protein
MYGALCRITFRWTGFIFFRSGVTTMQLPEYVKPGFWGFVAGATAMVVVGFSGMGWTTARTAERTAIARADAAVVATLVPFCVAKAQQDADGTRLAKFQSEESSYVRGQLVRDSGWATFVGSASPDFALTQACAEKLHGVKAG